MPCLYTCSACGKMASAVVVKDTASPRFGYKKPDSWLNRFHEGKVYDACSEECAKELNRRLGSDAEVWGEVK